jgi:hypothetical protein
MSTLGLLIQVQEALHLWSMPVANPSKVLGLTSPDRFFSRLSQPLFSLLFEVLPLSPIH